MENSINENRKRHLTIGRNSIDNGEEFYLYPKWFSRNSTVSPIQMLHKSHCYNELDGNLSPSSGVFWPQLVAGRWPKARISKSTKYSWNSSNRYESQLSWYQVVTLLQPVLQEQHTALWDTFLAEIPSIHIPFCIRNLEMCWEVSVRMANLQSSSLRIFSTWVASSVADSEVRPARSQRDS